MFAYDEPCYCRVLTLARTIYTMPRTRNPILDWIEIGPLAQAVMGFDPLPGERITDLVTRIATDPAAAVQRQIEQQVNGLDGGSLPRGWALDPERHVSIYRHLDSS